MDKSQQILSDITVYMKYAKYIPELNRRETWEEIVNRNMMMHIKRFPNLKNEIIENYKLVFDKKVLPSMRSLQFSGKPIDISPNRLYNCCFLPIDHLDSFSETMFLLLGGSGVGFSVQKHDIEKLPEIRKPNTNRKRRYLINDSIEGWADSIKILMKSYFGMTTSTPVFDFSDIRPKGARLVTSGGKAPGPQPLKDCIHNIRGLLDSKQDGDKLKPIEVHDIICHIADAVLAGGIRRAALISLFSADDMDMISCKSGSWWEENPQRGRANNSAVLVRHKITKDFFMDLWKRIEASGSGEPGIFLTNDKTMGTNPCKPLRSKILTPDGYITFKEALDKESLQVITKGGKVVNATKPFKTGIDKEVFEIKLSNGLSLYGTDNHEHMLKNGLWKEVKDLKVGDKLKIGHTQIYDDFKVDNNSSYNEGLLHGWMLGDGWNFKRCDGNSNRGGLCFGHQEFDVISLFENITGKQAKPHHQKPDTCKIIRVDQSDIKYSDKWVIPFGENKSYKIGFIRSLFTADGSVRNSRNCVELYSIKRDMLEEVCLLLQEFGIRSTISIHNNKRHYIAKDGKERNNKTIYKLNVYAGQFKRIGFISNTKNNLLELQNDKGLFRRKDYETIIDINSYSKEDVYDITVDDDSHSFIDTGIVTHNCAEIALRPNQFCNLCEVNVSDIESQEDLNNRMRVASFIGTLQASYTDFHYLRDIWKRNTEKDALIGVSMTGIASGVVLGYDLVETANIVKEENERVANIIGINKAARCTTVKPAGTTSLVLGTSSGIHAWHNDYYIRRIRVNKNESIYKFLVDNYPEIIEDEYFRPHDTAVISIPQKAPDGAILRNESPFSLLERIKKISDEWISNGHRSGSNKHNVSATISLKPEDWELVGDWMWVNRKVYNGLSVLPYDGGTYKQAPFTDCTEEEYNRLFDKLSYIDLSQIVEVDDDTNLSGELACVGGSCEIV